jgi:AraC family transcriptional regulator
MREPFIKILTERKLVGKKLTMTYSQNRTYELWRSFMPERKDIKNSVNNNLFSLQVYNESFDFSQFDNNKSFEKWAAIEVSDFSAIPHNMESFILTGGLYAVFIHKGAVKEGPKTFQHIFGKWMPGSGYVVDQRPHFEILGDKYKNDDPDSEEEIWIPIRPKYK